ncbi:MAG: PCMD domain-containing protein [Bacteroidales bacterium]|nr:PCMD domain-containing protein [Bacteroidales bacterium]MCM1148075.1 PCMD domain-containing protein [Bacteroidales bacterium]MCM1207154.1 PCMD domain-containing protein [Bacillota bacterium]MCM1509470.1 PCMD domain-containing protein [Clostridium sp.]
MLKVLGKVCAAVTVCSGLTACFKDEPLNAECDIEKAWIHYEKPEECTWNLSDTIIDKVYTGESDILFKVKPGTDRTSLAPQFVITEGATLSPASGTPLDFTNGPQKYTVTSEDGEWNREYRVTVAEERRTVRDIINFDFERVATYTDDVTKKQYYVWSDLKEDGTEANNWASGNGGFSISNPSAKIDDYPTVTIEDGYEGKGVRLMTKATGSLAQTMKMPMAAGNLFLGKFITQTALINALESTHFGLPFDKKPVKFTGYYKYQPGPVFTDRYGNIEADRKDEGAIYAILYRNHDEAGNAVVLHGDNVQTSEQIVAKAILPEVRPTDEWTAFEVDFDYYGNEIDMDMLNSFGYSLAVVFSSSKDGAYFQGAIGSTLYIDKVTVICETSK